MNFILKKDTLMGEKLGKYGFTFNTESPVSVVDKNVVVKLMACPYLEYSDELPKKTKIHKEAKSP